MENTSPWWIAEKIRITNKINQYRSQELKVFASCSFQSHSIPLLHLLSEIEPKIPIAFLNTGFHFAETLAFKAALQKDMNLNVIDVLPLVSKINQRDIYGNLLYTSDTDQCCFLNKTAAMNSFISNYDVWISGVRADQTLVRKQMSEEAPTPEGKLRYHPILNWNNKMIFEYAKHFNLPKHPLESKGYLSVGCEPCTRKFDFDAEREGRWFGQKKTECGLHTELIAKN